MMLQWTMVRHMQKKISLLPELGSIFLPDWTGCRGAEIRARQE